MIEERAHLLPLAEQGFELAEVCFPARGWIGLRARADQLLFGSGQARHERSRCGFIPSYVEVRHEGRCIARHERSYGRQQQVLDLEHYLDVLERKPGALAGSKPLAAWRERGLWPAEIRRLLEELISRHGKQSGTRQMIQVLSLVKKHGHERLRAAVEEALALGCSDVAAVRHLLTSRRLPHARSAIIELGGLARYERPLPVLTDYDQLLEPGGGVMSARPQSWRRPRFRQQCKLLHMPAVAAQCAHLAEQAVRERQTHLGYLEALLRPKLEERERRLIERRLRERPSAADEDTGGVRLQPIPKVSAAQIQELAEGDYIGRAEPIIFIGDSWDRKNPLADRAVLWRPAGRSAGYVSPPRPALVNELVEAKHQLQLRRALARWARYDLIALDEVGYVPLAEVGAEFLFQVIAERAEKAAVIMTTNLPFSEWTQVIPNTRLCKALLDRMTDRAHIIETGTESYRFRRTAERRKTPASVTDESA